MTSENHSNKARDVVLLIGLVFFVLSGLTIEVESCETKSSCDRCGSHRSERTRHWFAYGALGSSLTGSSILPSRFAKDFPEFKCDHQWSDESEIEEKIWDSPLIGLSHNRAMSRIWSSCCLGGFGPVWKRYETDEAYRDSIEELLETGVATRERLVALASESGYPQEEVLTPEEELWQPMKILLFIGKKML